MDNIIYDLEHLPEQNNNKKTFMKVGLNSIICVN